MQGNEVFFLYFGANGTPDLNPIVINDKPIDVASRAKVLGVNISIDLKRNHHIVEVVQKARGTAVLSFSIKRRRCRPQ